MNSSLEVNDTKVAKVITNTFSKRNIKHRFSLSLALSSVGKLFALFIAVLMTASVALFSTSLLNVFNKAIDKTYQNRDYAYKTDLISPTVEGGKYTDLKLANNSDVQEINQMLYVPSGMPEEGYTYLNDYFKPGYNEIINTQLPIARDPQGNPTQLVDANGKLEPSDTTLSLIHI